MVRGLFTKIQICLWMLLLAGNVSFAQLEPINSEDYDILFIPVGRSSEVQRGSLNPTSLADRGIKTIPVMNMASGQNYPLGDVDFDSENDCIEVRLESGEAVRLMSDPIQVESKTVYLSALVSVQGATPQQAAMAVVDIQQPDNITASLSFNQDVPIERQELALQYERQSNQVVFVIQMVGPRRDEAVVRIERIRLLENYHHLQYALDTTQVSANQHFGGVIRPFFVNQDISTEFAQARISSYDNRNQYPDIPDRSLILETERGRRYHPGFRAGAVDP